MLVLSYGGFTCVVDIAFIIFVDIRVIVIVIVYVGCLADIAFVVIEVNRQRNKTRLQEPVQFTFQIEDLSTMNNVLAEDHQTDREQEDEEVVQNGHNGAVDYKRNEQVENTRQVEQNSDSSNEDKPISHHGDVIAVDIDGELETTDVKADQAKQGIALPVKDETNTEGSLNEVPTKQIELSKDKKGEDDCCIPNGHLSAHVESKQNENASAQEWK